MFPTSRYSDWMESKLTIRKELKKKWYFDCICPRCQSPTDLGTYVSSPKCPNCDENGLLIPVNPLDYQSQWRCEKCSKDVDVDFIQKIEEKAKNTIKEMSKEKAR